MNQYTKILQSALPLTDPEPFMDALYAAYRELHPQDPEPIRRDFAQLDSILSRLPLSELDQVWNLTCHLCSEHEQTAFLEGIRLGARPMMDAENDPAI